MSIRAGKIGYLPLCLLWTLAVTACRQGRLEEIPGQYRFTADWGVSILTLHQDRSLEQEIKVKGGETKRLFGSWEFKDGYLTLTPCWALSRTSWLRADNCGMSAEHYASRDLQLWFDTDAGLYYEKLQE